jgi:hypothetical protein
MRRSSGKRIWRRPNRGAGTPALPSIDHTGGSARHSALIIVGSDAPHPPSFAAQRARLQARLREEVARASRYDGRFALLVFEATAAGDVALVRKTSVAIDIFNRSVRSFDLVAQVFDDTIAVLLVSTEAVEARAALLRMRDRIALAAPGWHTTMLLYPRDAAAIAALPLMTAA